MNNREKIDIRKCWTSNKTTETKTSKLNLKEAKNQGDTTSKMTNDAEIVLITGKVNSGLSGSDEMISFCHVGTVRIWNEFYEFNVRD